METEVTIGEGDEFVYLYYFKNDRDLAISTGSNEWECKIGFSSVDPLSRIADQKISMARKPVVGLLIKTDHGNALESAIHTRLADRRIGEAGDEWFITNPTTVHQIAVSLSGDCKMRSPQDIGWTIRKHREKAGLSQTELAEKCEMRQATISKIESGGEIYISSLLNVLDALNLKIEIKPRQAI
jgi:HTH-type transcriptional regulator/antitoxin HipB